MSLNRVRFMTSQGPAAAVRRQVALILDHLQIAEEHVHDAKRHMEILQQLSSLQHHSFFAVSSLSIDNNNETVLLPPEKNLLPLRSKL